MRLILLPLLTLIAAIPACADSVLQNAAATVQVSADAAPVTATGVPDSLRAIYESGPFGGSFVSGRDVGGLDPSVTATVNFGAPASGQTLSASTVLTYEFIVNGPAGESVGVNITGAGSATSSLPMQLTGSNAYLTVTQGGATVLSECAEVGFSLSPCTSVYSSFSLNQAIDVQTDTPYLVTLGAAVMLQANSGNGSYVENGVLHSSGFLNYQGSATVDPTITLDTSDPAYSLEFSPGLLATATPEPSTFALAATGLLACTSRLRRRRV